MTRQYHQELWNLGSLTHFFTYSFFSTSNSKRETIQWYLLSPVAISSTPLGIFFFLNCLLFQFLCKCLAVHVSKLWLKHLFGSSKKTAISFIQQRDTVWWPREKDARTFTFRTRADFYCSIKTVILSWTIPRCVHPWFSHR